MRTIDYLLFEKIKNDDFKAVKKLIDEGADVNAYGEYGNSPLHIACTNKKVNLSIIDLLINNGADVNAKNNDAGTTPLQLACMDGRLDLVKKLVEKGANINMQDDLGNTALMQSKWDEELIKYLIKNGADVESMTSDGNFLLLEMAGKLNKPELAELFLKNVNKEKVFKSTPDLLHHNVYFPEVVKKLALAGINVDKLNEFNETALAVAVKEDVTKTVKVLLESGASTKYKDQEYDNNTLLHIACKNDNYEIAKLLLEGGMNANILNKEWETPLHLVTSSNDNKIAKLLFENGAIVDAKNKYGRTPVDYAQGKDTEASKYILINNTLTKNKVK